MKMSVKVLQAIADDSPRKDQKPATIMELISDLTGEKTIYSFQLPSLEEECRKYILKIIPDIKTRKEDFIELDPIPNHIARNPLFDMEKLGYEDPSHYLKIIPPLFKAAS